MARTVENSEEREVSAAGAGADVPSLAEMETLLEYSRRASDLHARCTELLLRELRRSGENAAPGDEPAPAGSAFAAAHDLRSDTLALHRESVVTLQSVLDTLYGVLERARAAPPGVAEPPTSGEVPLTREARAAHEGRLARVAHELRRRQEDESRAAQPSEAPETVVAADRPAEPSAVAAPGSVHEEAPAASVEPAERPQDVPPLPAPEAADETPAFPADVAATPPRDEAMTAPEEIEAPAALEAPVEVSAVARPRRRRGPAYALRRLIRPAALLNVLLFLVLVALAFLLTPLPKLLFDVELLPVLGGSMEPTIPIGSVIAVRPVPASQLRPGDVITFADQNRSDVLVTHRIVDLQLKEGQQVAVTKGDANQATDSWQVPVSQAVGKEIFFLPYLGYVLVWLGSQAVRTAAMLVAVLLFILPSLLRGRDKAPPAVEPPSPQSFSSLAEEIDALLGESSHAPAAATTMQAEQTAPDRPPQPAATETRSGSG